MSVVDTSFYAWFKITLLRMDQTNEAFLLILIDNPHEFGDNIDLRIRRKS